ncbi:replication-like protein [Lactiplantibacillus plantarum]|uniref:DUF536 domain-containing protein n=1 Tax=Lactiplantibacillus plantarum TaxID=1590 RepID=UPI0008637B2D|nr:DUF536 domain-containing protein [Lactiplantibacillus plantarum]OEZ36292.1 replication-like protein [Lactiplantibacillus plantarum]WBB05608.1 DUF536 domain-containing protein [Lactiplantibacillus plantarum]
MPKTIRELATELKVSKQTIQYHYQRLPAKNRQKDSRGANIINPTAERIIRNKVAKPLSIKNRQRTDKEVAKSSKDNDWIVPDLKREIVEIKKNYDKQLATKDQQIKNLTKLLDQSQQLQLIAEKKIEESKMIATKQSTINNTERNNSGVNPKLKKAWWHFW